MPRTVKILERTISLTFTASPLISPHLELQPDIAHTKAHVRRRGTGGARYELEEAARVRLRVGERPPPASQ
jgi:hypothetical protein